ncbi:extracellular solute-binding protein [Brotonthovivens ammoniilytica]|uniref:Extracellular solute-binding protein n=1 Tax=Brotonthovivens ammoniilytica TaxID=2981725 RepID=A0ABT2TLR7_9FIRM|nr:extracellular solute-binding protein [Brotonthovivens ammoniilytica]MCU6763159.1 extracellular solute-binding protein [Brotonthovivens ammoniilytica]
MINWLTADWKRNVLRLRENMMICRTSKRKCDGCVSGVRKAAAYILAAVLLLMCLWTEGCSGKADDSGSIADSSKETEAKASLDVWIFFDENTPGTYYVDLWEELGEQMNCSINLKTYSTEQIKDKLKIALACRELPDIFAVWGGTYPDFLFDAGACLPVQEYLNDSGMDFKESYTVPYEDGNNYIIPCLVEAYAVTYCNRQLMDEIGITMPENWKELLQTVEKVREYNQENGTAYSAFELGDKDSWLGELLYTVMVNQLDPYAQEKLSAGTMEFSDGVFTEAARKLVKLTEAGAFPDDFLETGEVEAIENFINGEAVFFPHQSTIMYYLMDTMGEDAVSMEAFPYCGDEKNADAGNYMVDINHTLTPGLCISSDTEDPKLAAKLCLTFSRQVNERNVTEYGYLNILNQDYLKMPEQLPGPVQQFHQMIDNAEHFTPLWYAVLEKEDGDNWRNLTKKLLGRDIDIDTFMKESKKYLNFS